MVDLDLVTKEELLELLEELYDECGEHPEYVDSEAMDKIQALFIKIGVLVP
jgi:hypothetical protein